MDELPYDMGGVGLMADKPDKPTLFSVTVTGGIGSVTMSVQGVAILYTIDAPSASSTYDIEWFYQAPGQTDKGVAGSQGQVGDCAIHQRFQAHPNMKCQISNATEDGTYEVTLCYES